MSPDENSRAVVTDAFEELALAVGGINAVHALPDPAVWDLARSISHILRRTLARLVSAPVMSIPGDHDNPDEHPAISRLLRQIREREAT